MKELDKTKVYYLGDLNEEELKDINTYLFKIDLNWELFSDDELKQIERKDTLWFDTYFIGWKINNKTPTANAKELFTPNYEVTMIAEQPKENNFKAIGNSIVELLEYKNSQYGNSALEPLDIFNNKCKVGQRLDDKLARIKNAKELRKNDVCDLIGYLFLTCQENEWFNFDEFKD